MVSTLWSHTYYLSRVTAVTEMSSKQNLRKQQLERKLGLCNTDVLKSNFSPSITDIIWDILQARYNVFDHPELQGEQDMDWVFFLVVHKIHAAVWAVTDAHMKNVPELVSKPFITKVDVKDYIKPQCAIRRYHVIYNDQSDRYFVQVDDLILTSPEFDICLYVGTLTIPEKTLDVIMATLADGTYLLLASDCLEYCKRFVNLYFELIEEEMSRDQTTALARLTVTTNVVSQISERTGRQNRSSGFSLRGVLTSTFFHVFLATTASNVLLFLVLKKFMKR